MGETAECAPLEFDTSSKAKLKRNNRLKSKTHYSSIHFETVRNVEWPRVRISHRTQLFRAAPDEIQIDFNRADGILNPLSG